ncbi:aminoglycoside phosphotransferase family protein [Xanthomarina sp. F1114]|uniref:phosphotransferase enzyme family protein n=1 Tax=Xanthomarina sp. F1114 TaxID=2996019 RepID=UPI00225E51E2|nr:aminoglycoside phosphotransferase family protein [Xanthomarina sp. F1114]MCX7548065.1 aminoglycoside phosphotransferase family protein [Xanthomarina sp. F1114]
MEILKNIFNQFQVKQTVVKIEVLASGHINDTYLVYCSNGLNYVLQKINDQVFNNLNDIILNKVIVSNHLKTSYQKSNNKYQIAGFIKTENDAFFVEAHNGCWTLMEYIPKSKTIDRAHNEKQVFEASKLFGNFIAHTEALNTEGIIETLPKFHSVPFRFFQFEEALKQAKASRKAKAQELISFALEQQKEMFLLSELKEKDNFPIRVTHNDAKLSNILFDKEDNGLAVIDLDTVMPGIVHFDFGDSIRSICSNTVEDSEDLEGTTINLKFYEAFCKGFALETSNILTSEEKRYLPLGVKTIIFIMGLRFLTDYLNNDVYYKTAFKEHNLVRAKNQMALLKSAIQNYDEIKRITYSSFNL